jgi:hypothetical protein
LGQHEGRRGRLALPRHARQRLLAQSLANPTCRAQRMPAGVLAAASCWAAACPLAAAAASDTQNTQTQPLCPMPGSSLEVVCPCWLLACHVHPLGNCGRRKGVSPSHTPLLSCTAFFVMTSFAHHNRLPRIGGDASSVHTPGTAALPRLMRG